MHGPLGGAREALQQAGAPRAGRAGDDHQARSRQRAGHGAQCIVAVRDPVGRRGDGGASPGVGGAAKGLLTLWHEWGRRPGGRGL
nr:hypothetical protein GCM10025732_37690 [Glycomyces mayteni]